MNKEEFIQAFAKIEWQEEKSSYGMHPYHAIGIDEENKLTVVSMFDVSSVRQCYSAATRLFRDGAKKVLMAVDFPAMFDITNDFVCIYNFQLEPSVIEVTAIIYDNKTGKQKEIIMNDIDTPHDTRSKALGYILANWAVAALQDGVRPPASKQTSNGN